MFSDIIHCFNDHRRQINKTLLWNRWFLLHIYTRWFLLRSFYTSIWLCVSCIYGYMCVVFIGTCVCCIYGYVCVVFMAMCVLYLWLRVCCIYESVQNSTAWHISKGLNCTDSKLVPLLKLMVAIVYCLFPLNFN